jgi:hypothetical protein
MSSSLAACFTLMPGCFASVTASSLNSRLYRLLCPIPEPQLSRGRLRCNANVVHECGIDLSSTNPRGVYVAIYLSNQRR